MASVYIPESLYPSVRKIIVDALDEIRDVNISKISPEICAHIIAKLPESYPGEIEMDDREREVAAWAFCSTAEGDEDWVDAYDTICMAIDPPNPV